MTAPIYTRCLTTPDPFGPFGCSTFGSSYPVVPTPLTNVAMQRTPECTGNVSARYTADLAGGKLALSGNLYYSSSFFFAPSGIQFPQDAFATLSLRAESADLSDRYTVALWGDNVTSTRYLAQVQYGNCGIGGNWSKPATFGIELGARF